MHGEKDWFEVEFTVYHRSSLVACANMHFDNGTTDEEIEAEYRMFRENVEDNISGGWERV